MTTKRAKPGPKPKDRTGRYDLRVSQELAKRIDRAAAAAGTNPTQWLTRAALLALAKPPA